MNNRYEPREKKMPNGKVCWCVYDNLERRFSTLPCFSRYKTKVECQSDIDFASSKKLI